MGAEWINPVLEWAGKHLSWRWVFAICCVASIFLFLPQRYLIRFGLQEFSQKYHVWLAIAFLLTGAFLCTYSFSWLRNVVTDSIQEKRFLRRGKERLSDLSLDEKVLLRKFVHTGGSVLKLNIMNGTAQVLCHERLILPASLGRWHLGSLGTGFPYKIQPWVLKYLREHPECLQ
jgi:MFS family permease